MTQSISINPYTWVNLSSELTLVADTVYDFKISGTLGYIAQLATEPTSTGQATQLTSVSPSVNLKETAGLSIYVLGSNANILSVNESFEGSGGGDTTTLGAVSPTVETGSSNIIVSEQTNYMLTAVSSSTVDLDLSLLSDNRELYVFAKNDITITVNGEIGSASPMASGTFLKIIKSAVFVDGYNIVG